MAFFDVFNGDADGICALVQLRLAEPRTSQLITGVKRDINLMAQLQPSAGDDITVLDISLDKNRAGLETALAAGAKVFYADHHFAGEIPEHDNLQAHINTNADVCTSLLVNGHLQGKFLAWAVVGAFGDNLNASATTLAKSLDLTAEQLEALKNLGIYLNYNGYGSSLEDLHFDPADLYQACVKFESPFDFMASEDSGFAKLEQGYQNDMASADRLAPIDVNDVAAVYRLPNEPWARRVSGVFGNDLANRFPDRAHGIVTEKADANFLVSVRAPLNNKVGADEICRSFATGGGRAAAAGINDLPTAELSVFIDALNSKYKK